MALSKDERDRLILAALKLRMDVSTFIRLMTLPDTVCGLTIQPPDRDYDAFPLPHKY